MSAVNEMCMLTLRVCKKCGNPVLQRDGICIWGDHRV